MNDLFHGFELILAHIDDLFISKEGDITYHVHKFKLRLNELKKIGLKSNIENLFLGQTKMEYLGFWVTCDDVKIINIKIEAITNMNPPTSQKEVRQFIGIINY